MSRRGLALTLVVAAALRLASAHADTGTATVERLREYSAHTRVAAGGATLALPGVRLVVPPGVLPSGAVIGLGVAGVPDQAGALAGTGVVVTASAPLRGAVVVVVTPGFTDDALVAGRTPTLLDVVRGTLMPCLAGDGRFACAVPAAGAYTVRGSDAVVAAGGRALLEGVMATPPVPARRGPAALVAALWTAALACAGGAAVLLRK